MIERTLSRLTGAGVAGTLLVLAPHMALAHHAMGGVTPDSFATGFISGLAHPVIGLDHLAFVVAVGLLALGSRHRFLMPLAFVLATVAGTLLHLQGASLPAAEVVIALSVLIAGGLVIAHPAFSVPVTVSLFVLAGLFHGYAYGESIFGAEETPVLAYLAGFAAIQYAVALAAMMGLAFLGRQGNSALPAMRVAGGIVVGVALVFLHGEVMPF